MSRQVTVPAKQVTESIITTQHNNGSLIIAVGEGNLDTNNVFTPFPNQAYSTYVLDASLYKAFIKEFKGSLAETGLWKYVDMLRAGATTSAPNDTYKWDSGTSKWVGDIILAKEAKIKEIETQRDLLIISDITYDAKGIQAGLKDQELIKGKILEVQSSIATNIPLTNMVWRDKANKEYTWTVEANYLKWLQGLVIAISKRTTKAYIDSWIKKKDISALTTFKAVDTYII